MDFTQFRKPQRYIGNEWNVVKKSHKGRIPICISYPDLYELGMSNLGLRIIYGLLNDYPEIVCERVFMPFDDLSEHLQASTQKLFSLESKTPLNQFQVIGFNFNPEFNYTNFLHILELGGIKRYAKDREDIIVLGGGLVNPEPIADFVDVFVLGEFEAVANDFIRVLKSTSSKEARLREFAKIEGFYVPKFYENKREGDKYSFRKWAYIFTKNFSYVFTE